MPNIDAEYQAHSHLGSKCWQHNLPRLGRCKMDCWASSLHRQGDNHLLAQVPQHGLSMSCSEQLLHIGKLEDAVAGWLPGVSQKRNLHSNGYLIPGILQVTMHLTLCCALPQCSSQDISH